MVIFLLSGVRQRFSTWLNRSSRQSRHFHWYWRTVKSESEKRRNKR